jgi:uncharacterized membrane protein
MEKETVEKDKTTAVISYVLFVGVLIALSMNSENRNPFASFHIRQSLGLTITFIALGLLISNFENPMITLSMWIFIFVLWTLGIFNAIQGQTKPIPLLGAFFQKAFKNIQ